MLVRNVKVGEVIGHGSVYLRGRPSAFGFTVSVQPISDCSRLIDKIDPAEAATLQVWFNDTETVLGQKSIYGVTLIVDNFITLSDALRKAKSRIANMFKFSDINIKAVPNAFIKRVEV